MTRLIFSFGLFLVSSASLVGFTEAKAADSAAPTPSASSAPSQIINGNSAEQSIGRLPIDRVKERYWENGRETELRVVQNRLYTQAKKFEFGVFGGFVSQDPFLSIKNYGAELSYHLDDFWAITLMGWKDASNPSSALNTLEQANNVTANTNIPNHFYGGVIDYVPIYGKLSLVGKAIIYFDTRISLGLGKTQTETGNNVTPLFGVGEQIYLNRYSSLRIDYRLFEYGEDLAEKTTTAPNYGQIVSHRTSWNSNFIVGLTIFSGLF